MKNTRPPNMVFLEPNTIEEEEEELTSSFQAATKKARAFAT